MVRVRSRVQVPTRALARYIEVKRIFSITKHILPEVDVLLWVHFFIENIYFEDASKPNDDSNNGNNQKKRQWLAGTYKKEELFRSKVKNIFSRDLAESWADEVEDRTKKIYPDIPITFGEAINEYINRPLLPVFNGGVGYILAINWIWEVSILP